ANTSLCCRRAPTRIWAKRSPRWSGPPTSWNGRCDRLCKMRRVPAQSIHEPTRRIPRRSRARWELAALVLLMTSAVHAGEADYRLDNEGWNGTSELAVLARAAGLVPEMRANLDWSALGEADGVMILYPKRPLDARRLRAFVAGGGRVLVADDFGSAEA